MEQFILSIIAGLPLPPIPSLMMRPHNSGSTRNYVLLILQYERDQEVDQSYVVSFSIKHFV